MLYKFHNNKFDNMGRYYDVIRKSMNELEHREVVGDSEADMHFYNHITNEEERPGMIIVKPTAPTSKHFQMCKLGYANSSAITFEDPCWWAFTKIQPGQWGKIEDMVKRRANKWDDSILLKWRDSKAVRDNHILIIGQMPDDETVNGFGFGNHITKLEMIVEKLKDRNLVIKLHPRYKNPSLVKKWENAGHQVITGYKSIHSILPKTWVAIVDNSTAGIECMMHDVPIISYGYPDYHWITKDLRSLTRLNNNIDNLRWFNKKQSREFLCWYVFNYLCTDIPTTTRRLKELL